VATTVEVIQITGLREFRKSLKEMDGDLAKRIRLVGNDAAKLVVQDAAPKVPLGPGRKGHARYSIKVRSTQTAVRVAEGGKRYPYMPWLDFGGTIRHYKRKGIRRPFRYEGRYIWSTWHDRQEDVSKMLQDGLAALAADAGLVSTED
jgi:hypothetical protein